MLKQALICGIFAFAALSTSACGAATSGVAARDVAHRTASAAKGDSVSDQHLSISQRFATLDDYLLWLRKMEATADGAWYKEIRPGVYELQTGGNLKLDDGSAVAQQRIFTRKELEKMFGFSK